MRRRRRNFPNIIFLLLLALLLTGMAIVWLGIPILAETEYGPASTALTSMQKWSYSLQLLLQKNRLTNPLSEKEQEVTFIIEPGDSVTQVAISLEDHKLISRWQGFRYYLIYKGWDTQIKAGTFELSPTMTTIQIAQAVQSTYTEDVPFYIFAGWRAEEIAASLVTSGIEVTPEEFMIVVNNPSMISLPSYMTDITSLEGFLFPGSYTIKRKITAQDLASTFVQRFDQNMTPELVLKLQENALSFPQAITLASIIQKETFDDNERSRMASVFYNRLAVGMKLETDPTVQYALGYSDTWGGWWKNPLTSNDLLIQSPFSTYYIYGLPQHAISNPAMPSILAVANPEVSPYFYFRAKCDNSGSHNFSTTYEEHLSKACQ